MKAILTLVILITSSLVLASISDEKPIITPATKPELSQKKIESWSNMVGTWYGVLTNESGIIREQITTRYEDGTYKVTFRNHETNDKYKDSTEAGNWGISGPIYFTIYRGWLEGTDFIPSDPSDPYNYDAYKIIQLDTEVFVYESYSTKTQFSLKKVPNDFEFPQK